MFHWLALLALLLAGAAGAAPNATAPVNEDAWASPMSPDSPQSAYTLEVGAGEAYLKFVLPRNARIQHARLAGTALSQNGSRFGRVGVAEVEDDSWSASTLTWNTRPPAAPTFIGEIGVWPGTQGFAEVSLDVTSIVQAEQLGDGVLSLNLRAFEGIPTSAVYAPRESLAYSSFHLDLELDAELRIEAGDLVLLEPGPDVVAVDPETDLRKRIGQFARFARWPQQIALDPRDGSIVAYDPCDPDGSLFRLSVDGSPTSVAAPPVGGCASGITYAMTVDSQGSIFYFAAWNNVAQVMRFDGATGTQGPPAYDGWAECLTVEPDDRLVVCEGTALVRIDPATGLRSQITSGGSIVSPRDLSAGAQSLWLVQASAPRLLRVDRASGTQSVPAQPPVQPAQVEEIPDGRLLVATVSWGATATTEIGVFDPDVGSWEPLLQKPHTSLGGLARMQDGSFVLAFDALTGPYLSRLDPLTGAETPFAAPLAREGGWIHNVAVEADRRLLAVAGDRIVRLDPKLGRQETVVVSPLADPNYGLEQFFRDVDGRLLVMETLPPPGGTRILALDPQAGLQPIVEVPIHFQSVVAEDADHFLGGESTRVELSPGHTDFIGNIWRIDRHTGVATIVSPNGALDSADEIVRDPSGALWIVDANGPAVVRLDLATGDRREIPVYGVLFWPSSVVRALSGKLFVRDIFGVVEVDPSTDLYRLAVPYPDVARYGGLAIAQPACADGTDNDGDGAIDFPADTRCASAEQDHEGAGSCGLGAELALALAALAVARRRIGVRRSRSQRREDPQGPLAQRLDGLRAALPIRREISAALLVRRQLLRAPHTTIGERERGLLDR